MCSDAGQLLTDSGCRSAGVNNHEVDIGKSVRNELIPFGIASFISPPRAIPFDDQAVVGSLRELFGHLGYGFWQAPGCGNLGRGYNSGLVARLEYRDEHSSPGSIRGERSGLLAADVDYLRACVRRGGVKYLDLGEAGNAYKGAFVLGSGKDDVGGLIADVDRAD